MPEWLVWVIVGLAAWIVVALVLAPAVGRAFALGKGPPHGNAAPRSEPSPEQAAPSHSPPLLPPPAGEARLRPRRILVVDDDPALRLLVRVTLPVDEWVVDEASSAEEGAERVRFAPPDLVVLDVGLPGRSGLLFCSELSAGQVPESPPVILLTGRETSEREARRAGAAALLRKPFSPLELIGLIDRLLAGEVGPADTMKRPQEEQLLVYAHDLGRLVQVERAQRRLLQQAYRQTVQALIDTLEAKDQTTRLHSQRVTRYALELTGHIEPSLLDDPSLEFGFLLHDIGKIGVPEAILNKPGPLEARERREMQQHPLIGADILAEVALLAGHGIEIVRSHHERWDGRGYPHRLANEQIPLAARIFALADALDSMTHDRPYRSRMSWQQATDEILDQSGRQFDPQVVRAFIACQADLRRISVALDPAALSAC